MENKISKLKKQRNNIYKQLRKVDNKITKEIQRQNEDTKKKYIGKYFKKKGYERFPIYVHVLRYNLKKGFELISADVDNGDTWILRYWTFYPETDWNKCSKKLFLEKLKKGLKQINGI